MYSVTDYGSMIADRVRMDAYAAALKASVRPGAVVIDIGTGTGICALLACQLGARHVYALEVNPAIVVARAIAADNGYADRITFVQQLSTAWQPPELADVIVSDLRGVLPLAGAHIPSIVDARTRLLKPGGIQIPIRDSLWANVVHAPRTHARLTRIWSHNRFGLDMSAALGLTVNQWVKAADRDVGALSEPVLGGVLDYSTLTSPNARLAFAWQAPRPGVAHGFVMWFDAEILDGIGFSNAPDQPPAIYGRVFFPWPGAVTLDGGEAIEVAVAADLVDGHYVWRWDTEIRRNGAAAGDDVRFRQSTFFGQPLDVDALRRRKPGHAPGLGTGGQVDLGILRGLSEGLTLQDVAQDVAARHPDTFADWRAAFGRVAEVAERYGPAVPKAAAGAAPRSLPAAVAALDGAAT